MKRFSFILSMLGIGAAAKAQTKGTVVHDPYDALPNVKSLSFESPKLFMEGREIKWLGENHPLNNQCPVCGTMAKPYFRLLNYYAGMKNCKPDSKSSVFSLCDAPTERIGPMEQITRCLRCNNAFWQDAEEQK